MSGLLDNIKNAIGFLFSSRKNLISVMVVLILVLAIPVGIYLIRQTQIFKSRATSDPIVFSGSNVTKDAQGRYHLVDSTNKTVTLQLSTNLGAVVESSAPSAPPASSAPASSAPNIVAPTLSFSVNPTIITEGDSVTLTWSSTNASKCVLEYPGVLSTLDPSGSTGHSPLETTTYSMRCEGAGGTPNAAKQTAKVTVNPVPPCKGKTGTGCAFDTLTTWYNSDGVTRSQSITIGGNYWNYNSDGGWHLTGQGDLATTFYKDAGGPCEGKSAGTCSFDVQSLYLNPDNSRDQTIIVGGKYWNYHNPTSGGWTLSNSGNLGDVAWYK